MDLAKVALDPTDAEAQYKQYLEVVKVRKEKQYEDLKKVYRALKQGYKVIDIFQAFEQTGAEDNHPKLAIAKADDRQVFFIKELGGGRFSSENDSWRERVDDVTIPGGMFPDWELTDEARGRSNWNIKDRVITTNVPIVPGHLLPEGKLENYYVLFEAPEWNPIAATDDPYLLRRINANTFIVLAEWDVTDVEKIVMRGV
jgi:hypothetical protein